MVRQPERTSETMEREKANRCADSEIVPGEGGEERERRESGISGREIWRGVGTIRKQEVELAWM